MKPVKVVHPPDTTSGQMHDKVTILEDRVVSSNLDALLKQFPG